VGSRARPPHSAEILRPAHDKPLRNAYDVTSREHLNPTSRREPPSLLGAYESVVIAPRHGRRGFGPRDHEDRQHSGSFRGVRAADYEAHVPSDVTNGAPRGSLDEPLPQFAYRLSSTQACRSNDEFPVVNVQLVHRVGPTGIGPRYVLGDEATVLESFAA
jgi:hypothetical protein